MSFRHASSLLRGPALVLGLLGGLAACASVPDAPEADNPFDPDGTAPGTGYELMATVDADSVVLTWPARDVNVWTVRHSAVTSEFAQMDDISVENVVQIAAGEARLVHGEPVLESVNYYAVRGQGMVPGESIAVDVPVSVGPGEGGRNARTRSVTVEVRTGVADQVELANQEDFSDGVVFDVTPGQTAVLDWTLPEAEAAGEELTVHVRARTSSSIGPAQTVDFVASFDPQLEPVSGQRLVANSLTAVDTLVVLRPVGDGITRLRLTRPSSADTTVVADPTAELAFSIPPDATEAVRWTALFDGELGYTVTRNISLTPALEIGDASIDVVGAGSTTTSRDIRLHVVAPGAGEMIVSEDPGFGDTGWTAVADTLDFTLSEGFGTKTIYAVFRNPFTPDRPTASTGITYLVPPGAAIPAAGRGSGGDPQSGRDR